MSNLEPVGGIPALTPDPAAKQPKDIRELYGLDVFGKQETGVLVSRPQDLYSYEVHVRRQVAVPGGDSLAFLPRGKPDHYAEWTTGPANVEVEFGVIVRGYTPPQRKVELSHAPQLPYVNGCATAQLFPPLRNGDPTLQHLVIPPYSAEQAHHIHSTVRAVYISKGLGVCVLGMEGCTEQIELQKGMVLVLHAMCPHHFETPQGEALHCIPFHVWSTNASGEFGHPMYSGTHMMDQGQ